VDGIAAWAKDNWFSLVQGTGIVGSLLFTAVSLRIGTKARKVSDILTLSREHRELWREVRYRPELARVSRKEVDLIATPITNEEEAFLNLVFVHFNTGWMLASAGSLLSLDTLAADVAAFFRLPIPRSVWEETKAFRDRGFVLFVETTLASHGRDDSAAMANREAC